MSRTHLLPLVGLLVLVAACGTAGDPIDTAHDGPPEAHVGAAAAAVTCDGRLGSRGDNPGTYDDGEAFDTADEAVADAVESVPLVGAAADLRPARTEQDRVLYTYDVDDRTVEALVVRSGRTIDDVGWYVESWARCDLAEFPASVADETGTQLWQDASGVPVDSRTIQSYAGPEHCAWQDMTFLEVGGATYVRHPEADLLDGFFTEDWNPATTLPADAHDTGFERDGDHLWLSADRERAYLGDADTVELWPREQQRLGCD